MNRRSVLTEYIQNFLKFRPLLNELVARDIKIKYRRSVLNVKTIKRIKKLQKSV